MKIIEVTLIMAVLFLAMIIASQQHDDNNNVIM